MNESIAFDWDCSTVDVEIIEILVKQLGPWFKEYA